MTLDRTMKRTYLNHHIYIYMRQEMEIPQFGHSFQSLACRCGLTEKWSFSHATILSNVLSFSDQVLVKTLQNTTLKLLPYLKNVAP